MLALEYRVYLAELERVDICHLCLHGPLRCVSHSKGLALLLRVSNLKHKFLQDNAAKKNAIGDEKLNHDDLNNAISYWLYCKGSVLSFSV